MVAVRRDSGAKRLVCWLALLALAGAFAPGAAQTPPPPETEPAPEPAEETPPEPAQATAGEGAGAEDDEAAEPTGPKLPKRLDEYVPDDQRVEVEVSFTADAPCTLRVDGEPLGELEPGVAVSFPVRSGQRLVRAVSLRFPAAVFSKTVKIRESGEQQIEVKMVRQIRELHRRQRREMIYRDAERSLMWTRRDNGSDLRWVEAQAYCEELALGGYEDWRLPTLVELQGLQAIWSRAQYKVVEAFTLSGCCPWSAERLGAARAWNFNFRHRRPFLGNVSYSLGLRALCIRAWDPEAESPAASEKPEAAEAGEPGEPGQPG